MTKRSLVRGSALAACVALVVHGSLAIARTPTQVACVGDSITFGAGASSPATSYPSDLAALFDGGVQVGNFGYTGATMLTTGNVPYVQLSQYGEATAFVSEAGAGAIVDVIIMLGTNDSKPVNWSPDGGDSASQFAADYSAMVDHFTALPTNPVVYLALPPTAFGTPLGIDNTVIVDQIVPIIKEVAMAKGMPVIDINTPTASVPQDYISDGVHFNDTGYALIAHLMYEGLLTEDAYDAGMADDAAPSDDAAADDDAADALRDGGAQGAPAGASAPRVDAGIIARDAGAETDGVATGAPASGCGCSLGARPATAAPWLVVVGLVAARRRRRG